MSAWTLPCDDAKLDVLGEATPSRGDGETSMEKTRRVLIADDRSRSRRGLRALLTTFPEIHVIGEASDGREAVRLVEERRPDTVLMDAKMPTLDGLSATRLIKDRWPETRVIVLTMYGVHRTDALGSGADAFLVKGCSPQALLEAILDHKERAR